MGDPAPRSRRRPSAGLIVGGLVALLVVWFALVNSQRVKIDFILFERDARLIYIILGSAILGAIAAALMRRRREHHRRER